MKIFQKQSGGNKGGGEEGENEKERDDGNMMMRMKAMMTLKTVMGMMNIGIVTEAGRLRRMNIQSEMHMHNTHGGADCTKLCMNCVERVC